MENYRDIFAPITYVETFKNLFLKYDQYTEPPNEELQDSTTSSATVSEKRFLPFLGKVFLIYIFF